MTVKYLLPIALTLAALSACAATSAAQSPQPLSLGDAARLAAKNSAPAVAARYRVEGARGRAGEARSALLPQVSALYADGKRTFNTASFGLPLPGFDPNGVIIGPVRTVDLRGRAVANIIDPGSYGRYLVAKSSAESSELEATQASQLSAAAAGMAYVRAMRAESQVRARSADSALAGELLAIAQRQLDVGVGVALDVTRARAQFAGVKAQLIAARSERDRSHLELARLLGIDDASTLSLRDTLSAAPLVEPPPTEPDAIAKARGQRADLGAAAAATATARRGMWAARAERLPSLGVFGDKGKTSKDFPNLKYTYTYGLQVTVPIFQGFRTSAHAQQASALLHESQAREHDVELQISTDVRAALIELAAARELLDASQERLSLGEQELAQSRERFRAGVAGNADVIIAQLNLTQARSQHVDALAALQSARVSLARSQGRVTELP